METASVRHPPGVYATGAGLRLGGRLTLLNLLLFWGDGLLHKCITTVWFVASPVLQHFCYQRRAFRNIRPRAGAGKEPQGLSSRLYSPECVEGFFREVRPNGVLRSSFDLGARGGWRDTSEKIVL
jgi:hypothetical protein